MHRHGLWIALGAIFFFSIGVLSVTSCGTSASDSSGNSAGTTVAAAVGGAVQGSDSGATAYYVPDGDRKVWAMNSLFSIEEAQAAICSLSNVSCTSGKVTVAYDGCTSKNGRVTFTGGYTLTLGGAAPSCPGSGFWKSFYTTAGASLWRTFTAGTTEVAVAGVTVTSSNTNPTGWDSTVTLSKNSTYSAYGLLRTTGASPTSTSTTFSTTETLMNYGVQYTATGTVKGASATLWDHVISFTGNGLTVTHTYDSVAGTDTKKVSSTDATSTVVTQHNLAKWTGTSSLSNVTYQHGTKSYCGCYPISGSINTTYNGSKTGSEQMTFTYGTSGTCGSYTVQSCSDSTCGTLTGTATTGTLTHCL